MLFVYSARPGEPVGKKRERARLLLMRGQEWSRFNPFSFLAFALRPPTILASPSRALYNPGENLHHPLVQSRQHSCR